MRIRLTAAVVCIGIGQPARQGAARVCHEDFGLRRLLRRATGLRQAVGCCRGLPQRAAGFYRGRCVI